MLAAVMRFGRYHQAGSVCGTVEACWAGLRHDAFSSVAMARAKLMIKQFPLISSPNLR
jgi:hypothetical protein